MSQAFAHLRISQNRNTCGILARALSQTEEGATSSVRVPSKVANKFSYEAVFIGTPTPSIPSDLKAKLEDPVENDPLALCVGDALLAGAQAESHNFVAWIPDDALVPAIQYRCAGQDSAQDLLVDLQRSRYVSVSQDESWTTVVPRYPLSAVRWRTNRKTLKDLIRRASGGVWLRLDEVAAYAKEQNKPLGQSDVDRIWLQILHPSVLNGCLFQLQSGYYPIVRLYEGLSESERAQWKRGGQLQVSELSADARKWLSDLAFGGTVVLQARTESGLRQVDPLWAFPSGVPETGRCYWSEETDSGVIAEDKATGRRAALILPALASVQYSREHGEFRSGSMPLFEQFCPATVRAVKMSFELMPEHTFGATLLDVECEENFMRYDALPESYRAQIEVVKGRIAAIQSSHGTQQRIPPAIELP